MLATFNVDKLDNIGMYLENQAKQAAVHVILLNTIDKKNRSINRNQRSHFLNTETDPSSTSAGLTAIGGPPIARVTA